ncbi:hypothetical protein AMJ57_05595 [Parcubacteria bacterium SG8_24]|nr:MAG: hypothetical protein AMJ57_05595 [Parcubacteria bacterium SG8_24]
MGEVDTLYARFMELRAEIAYLNSANCVLEWDMETFMPEAAADVRAKVMAHLSGAAHDRAVSPEYGDVLSALKERLDAGRLQGIRAATVRKCWKEYERERKLPGEFVRELADLCASSHHVWVRAKDNSDFGAFLPNLQRIVELKRQEAGLVGFVGSPYDALLDVYDPGTTTADVERVFRPLRLFLSDFIRRVVDSPHQPDAALARVSVPVATQELLCRRMAESLGFDFKSGRLDTSVHPFTTRLHPGDVRITTAYKEEDFLDALYSTIHEVGHGIYEQALSREHYGTPVGEAASYGFHESQSRMWENLVGRSRQFWEFYLPCLQHHAGLLLGVGPGDIYRAVNIVRPSLIRIEADEVTYNLHICLRFDIERGLIEGEYEPQDLPEVWKGLIREYLGVEVPDDARGVLQDVHWSAGYFGYFPSYALGNLYAAQLYAKAQSDIEGLEDGFREGKFRPLFDWLRDRVWCHGGALEAPELVTRSTGSPPDASHFTSYVERKFGEIYRI